MGDDDDIVFEKGHFPYTYFHSFEKLGLPCPRKVPFATTWQTAKYPIGTTDTPKTYGRDAK